MDASERDLDGGDIVGRGKGRRGLERGDRARVLAEACPELADPHVDGSVVGATQADGRLEVVDRLAVRIDRLGAGGGLERRGSGFGGPPRLALVRGDERVSGQVVSVRRPGFGPDRVGRPAVEQAAPSQARRLVRDVAHPPMDEVVGDGLIGPTSHLADDAAPHRFLESVDGLLVGPTAGGPDRREVERATDDGRRREDLRRGLADRPEPVAQERVDVARHRRARRLAARERRDDMERQSLGIAGERVDQRVVARVLRSDGTDQVRDRVARQPAEHETRGIGQPRQVGDHRLAAGS